MSDRYGKIPEDEPEIRERYAAFVKELRWPTVTHNGRSVLDLRLKPWTLTLPEGFQLLLEVGNVVRDGGHIHGLDLELVLSSYGKSLADESLERIDWHYAFAKMAQPADGYPSITRIQALGQWFNARLMRQIMEGKWPAKMARVRTKFVTLKYNDGYFQHATRVSVEQSLFEKASYGLFEL